MLAQKECLRCLRDLSVLAIELSIQSKTGLKTKNSILQRRIIKLLEQRFSTKKVPAKIFSTINRRIKKLTAVPDPFSNRKRIEMDISHKVALKLRTNYKSSLTDLLLYSATGNSIDFFKDINYTARQMQKNIFLEKTVLRNSERCYPEQKFYFFLRTTQGRYILTCP